MKSSKLIVALLLSFGLSGCFGTMEPFTVQKVEVPVKVPCKITMPDKQAMPFTEAKKDESDIFVIVQKALAEIEFRQGYETKLEAAIQECNK